MDLTLVFVLVFSFGTAFGVGLSVLWHRQLQKTASFMVGQRKSQLGNQAKAKYNERLALAMAEGFKMLQQAQSEGKNTQEILATVLPEVLAKYPDVATQLSKKFGGFIKKSDSGNNDNDDDQNDDDNDDDNKDD